MKAVARKYLEVQSQQRDAPRQQAPPPGQPLITDVFLRAEPDEHGQQHNAHVQLQRVQDQAVALEEVKREAVAKFWELLLDFVQLQVAPKVWLERLALDHPVLQPNGNRLQIQLAPRMTG